MKENLFNQNLIDIHDVENLSISVSDDKVEEVAVRLGCGVLNTLFNYLGSKVGGCMSRTQSWNEVVDKMVNRLSRWKMKTLSIGGRLTLLKPVLEKGCLRVSSLFALNRALLFKWVWRFFTQKETLWARVTSAIHGVDGGFGSVKKSGQAYMWCSITKEMERLASQDIDLFNFMQKKIGNGLSKFFWNDSWRGDTKLKDDFPRLYALKQDKSITVAAKFTQENFQISFRRLFRSGVETEQWLNFLERMEGVLLNS
nr:RNA-directed DNA polymerase, eukaryota, reverse transcriptase zinc-binding domain protein [Tanacetum cinerariifolium]